MVVDNDNARATKPRVNLLLRQVVVPSWLQFLLMIPYAYAIISLFIHHPLLAVAALIASLVFSSLVVMPLRRRAGQPTEADDDKEADAAPNRRARTAIRWRQFCTYQVWSFGLVIVIGVLVALDMLGIPTP